MVDSLFVVISVGLEVSCLGRAWALQYPCSLLLVFTEVLPACGGHMGGPELLASCSSPAWLALSYSIVSLYIAAIVLRLAGLLLLVL
jgi:hypothetical protein